MTDEIMNALFRTSMSFLVLLLLTRLLGKKQMSQLTFFNYITGITIGSIAANIVTLEAEKFFQSTSSLIWWCFLTYIVEIIAIKLPKSRILIEGEPSILIKKGKIQYKTLKKNRLDIDNLLILMREKDVFSVSDIEFAVLEPNGDLTIIKKVDEQQLVKKDLDIKIEPLLYVPTQLIISGVIIKKNLKELNLSYDWLYEQLDLQGVKCVKNVLYAEIKSNGTLYVEHDLKES